MFNMFRNYDYSNDGGHSFCYDCIYQWFSNKINCPTCRHDIENKPILNIHLKNLS